MDFLPSALELHGVISDTFKKFFRRLATEFRRMNALILRSTQVKISKRLGMLCEGEVDLNDRIFDDRHT